MKRLFIAISPSERIKEKIKLLVAGLQDIGADVNFVSPENIHFTLKFLGEVEDDNIEEIKEKLLSIAKTQRIFSLKIKKIGVFPSYERINIIWIGAESPELIILMKKVNYTLNHIYTEEREEVPHLTIARVKSEKNKEALKEHLQNVKNREFGEMVITKIILYESELTPKGPIYTVVEEFKLL